jgi:hypothetical protein
MDDQPPIVVSIPDDETPDERLVVSLDETLYVRTEDLPSEVSPKSGSSWRRSAVAVLIVLAVVGAGVSWYALNQAGGLPDPTTVALPGRPMDAQAIEADLNGHEGSLVKLVVDGQHLQELHSARSCRLYAASTQAGLGTPQELLSDLGALPESTVRGALTNVLDELVVYLSRCEDGLQIADASGNLRFATVVAARLLAKVRLIHQGGHQ